MLCKLATFVQLNAYIKCRLPTHGDQDRIRALLLDHAKHHLGGYRQKVHLVCKSLGSLHSCNVGVDQNDLNVLLLQRFDRLTSRVVKLTGLANTESSRADQDALSYSGHIVHDRRHKSVCSGILANALQECVKEERGVEWSTARFGVKLHTKVRLVGVDDALVGHVICIEEERLPLGGKRIVVYRKTVVLRGDVALGGAKVNAWLVCSAVTVLHLVCLCAGGKSEQLVSEADPKDRDRSLPSGADHVHYKFDVLRCSCSHLWVTRTVTDKETIELALVRTNVKVVRNYGELSTALAKLADDVELHTAVICKNSWRASGVVDLNLLGAHFSYEVGRVGVHKSNFVGLELDLTQT
mmetsp:Transcript_22006/g.38986  ORF Transcript_22006/g.38986 Transcript_22006/m.38986 type:complete len:353 (-) Transcript_22006:789-1847(-)